MPGDGKILISLPGTGVVVEYASQRERDQSALLAQARQRIAERTGYIPSWDQLCDADQETAILEARNWLRAAVECGLTGESAVTEWGVRYPGPAGAPGHLQRYYDEGDARDAQREVAALDPSRRGTIVSRQVWAGPWTPAPGKDSTGA